ncbi:Uu.00g116370.m01.CDS01 [Anthostomella pinea]|uniref:Uu.00g116370.m01.CDS01 n=1 Tax=Anthostomella pinea TaxID=933095 RepID=A0AAI8YEE7_9PEZI|nr:Uu.00g116370.m01.CDS01 [Anthostomella pinea]
MADDDPNGILGRGVNGDVDSQSDDQRTRMKYWTWRVNRFWQYANEEFESWEEGIRGTQEDWAMLWFELLIRDILGGLSRDCTKPGTIIGESRAQFIRAVEALVNATTIYVTDNLAFLTGPRVAQWRELVDELSRAPYNQLDDRIFGWVEQATALVDERAPAPDPAEAWNFGGLTNSAEFEAAYARFEGLREQTVGNEEDRRELLWESQEVLAEALEAVSLDANFAHNVLDAPEALFADATRPTYIDFAHDTLEAIEGRDGRQGVLALKRSLGCTLTPAEEAQVNNGAATPVPGSLKRGPPKESPSGGPAPKKPKAGGYSMTEEEALDDVNDIRRAVIRKGVTKFRPAVRSDRLVTPTLEYPENKMYNYRKDLWTRAEEWDAKYFTLDAIPKRKDARAMIKELGKGINSSTAAARAPLAPLEPGKTQPSDSKLKWGRIDILEARYLRALRTLLVVRSQSLRPEQVRRELSARLDTWILNERIWNAADRKSGGEDDRIAARRANITAWRQLQQELDQDVDDAEPDDSGDDDAVDDAVDGDDEPAAPAAGAPPSISEGDVTYGAARLREVLRTVRPGRTSFVDPRSERLREQMLRDAVKRAGRPAKPDKGKGKEPAGKGKGKGKAVDEDEAEAVDPLRATFTGTSGPPDHDGLPRDTVWQRILYMIILTQWRFIQAKDLVRD